MQQGAFCVYQPSYCPCKRDYTFNSVTNGAICASRYTIQICWRTGLVGALPPTDWTHKLNLVMYYSFHFPLRYLCGAV